MSEDALGRVIRIAGSVVEIEGLSNAQLYEIVRIGEEKLVGEVIRIQKRNGSHVSIAQVYEETQGLAPDDPAWATGNLLSVELGPGLINQIFDGIQRPLPIIRDKTGSWISRGIEATALDKEKEWEFKPLLNAGDHIKPGMIIGEVPETVLINHKILVPPDFPEGKLKEIAEPGTYPLKTPIGVLETGKGEIPLKMFHTWPVRVQRPFKSKLPATIPLRTGQRILDTFFPIAKGGTAGIPGGFGTGKTVTQHQLARWSDAKVVVYVGCGERGNEMTEVLESFPKLTDPYSGEPLMARTVLIANTSNMPVAAREASIYTGITLAEYYRDQGFDVALMADSTSRWAEALREISSRLEEMPGEQSFPAYLASRIGEFYERAGRTQTLNDADASISVIGAVSPGGGDFSEPVTQNTLRTVRVFWALDTKLAFARHFPAISWLESYSLYTDTLREWYDQNISPGFSQMVANAMTLLQKEKELQEIVQLVGPDALPEREKIILESARMIREDFLQQSAYSDDSYCSLEKQYQILNAIMRMAVKLEALIDVGYTSEELQELPVIEQISRLKWYFDTKEKKEFTEKLNEVNEFIDSEITRK
ncbi:MAG: V-type ATP synthase subunit A [Promethearchaeota archaeon]